MKRYLKNTKEEFTFWDRIAAVFKLDIHFQWKLCNIFSWAYLHPCCKITILLQNPSLLLM